MDFKKFLKSQTEASEECIQNGDRKERQATESSRWEMKVAQYKAEEASSHICCCDHYFYVIVVAFLPCPSTSQGHPLICRRVDHFPSPPPTFFSAGSSLKVIVGWTLLTVDAHTQETMSWSR